MFFDEQLNKINRISKTLPYIIFALFIWLFIMSIIIFLLFFNILDIKVIVEAMKQCVVSLSIF